MARRVVRDSAGYPYCIQEYGLELWNYAESSPICETDVEAVSEIVKDSPARSFFGTRLQMFTIGVSRVVCGIWLGVDLRYMRENAPQSE